MSVWGRSADKAAALAESLDDLPAEVQVVKSLTEATTAADVISTATLANDPLIRGAHIKPGTHVDLVGAFTPQMRESDDALMQMGRLFVDHKEGALAEAGDILQAINSGAISNRPLAADIKELCAGQQQGRIDEQETTIFKMVGSAEEDLITARFLWESAQE